MLLEELLPSLKLTLYAFDYIKMGSWWNYKKINSPYTRIFYTLDGKAEVRFNGETYILEKDTLIITPPFVPVDYYCEEYCENYYLLFTGQLATDIELFSFPDFNWKQPAPEGTAAYYKRLLELNPDRGLQTVDPHDKNYNEWIYNSGMKNAAKAGRNYLETDGILRILLSSFLEESSVVDIGNDISVKRVLKVLDYIEANIEKTISLEDMANVVSIHPNYFSDLFLSFMGERPISYLINKRIKRAQFLLATSNHLIKQIAIMAGFKDIDYFYRVFKKKTGMTPAKYRKQVFGK